MNLVTDKRDPASKSGSFEPWPWSIQVEGEVEKPGCLRLEDLIRPHQIEERIYRRAALKLGQW